MAEIFMQRLEKRALTTFSNPPETWYRFVDDTFTKLKVEFINRFLDHLNTMHEKIKFTMEEEEGKSIPFLDTRIHVKEDRTIRTTVYRKKTHTNQYLNFNSNHHIRQKLGIISTLERRMETIVQEEDSKEEEKELIHNAFLANDYPVWALDRKNSGRKKQDENQKPLARISIPYTKSLSERIGRTMRRYNLDVVHKPTRTIKNQLCNKAKDKLNPMDKPGAIYHIRCKVHNSQYVGETGRAPKERFYEHKIISHKDATRSHSLMQNAPVEEEARRSEPTRRSQRTAERRINYRALDRGENIIMNEGMTAVSEHMAKYNHKEGDIESKILDTETTWRRRIIKENIAIKKLNPDLNVMEEGKAPLSALYNNLPSKFVRPRTEDYHSGKDKDKVMAAEDQQQLQQFPQQVTLHH